MRVALIADIHGNRLALETVLAHMATQEIDQIVCLGDTVVLGPDPVGCLDLVAEHGAVTVMGNTDDWVLRTRPGVVTSVSDSPIVNEHTAWTRSQLSEAHIGQIEQFR